MTSSLKVEYEGELDQKTDAKIKGAAIPGVWWAQGYDFGANRRDILFDYKGDDEREEAIARIVNVPGAHVTRR